MFSVQQKVLVTLIVLGMNLLVLLTLSWFVVFSAVPSAMLLVLVLSR